jgi:hypothetical protein
MSWYFLYFLFLYVHNNQTLGMTDFYINLFSVGDQVYSWPSTLYAVGQLYSQHAVSSSIFLFLAIFFKHFKHYIWVRLQVFTAVSMKMAVFWDIVLHTLVDNWPVFHRCLTATYIKVFLMEAVSTAVMSVSTRLHGTVS